MNNSSKRAAAEAAFEYIKHGDYLGVGTGSTVKHFIDVLAERRPHLDGLVSSSKQTTKRLEDAGFAVDDLNSVGDIDLYVDGTDEINPYRELIKGGGGALTREKILAAAARRFVCMGDRSKQVDLLGDFALPIEVIDMARSLVARRLVAMGGHPKLRPGVITDNGHPIIDVAGLDLVNPVAVEDAINALPGVVTVGLFARRPADIAVIAGPEGIETLRD